MPVGFEEDRICKTADKLNADEVVLVVNREDSKEQGRHRENAEKELRKMGYDPVIEECNIFNLYQSLGMIAELIHRYEDEEVYVNIATGSKVTAVAGMIAAMMSRANAYYVRAKDYKEDEVPRGVKDIFELPRYPIDSPSLQHILVLDHLKDKEDEPTTKSDLIDFAESEELPFLSDRDVSRKAKYRLLDNHIIEPLLNDGYITISEEGRNRLVDISPGGENMIEAFGFMLEQTDKYEGRQSLSAS